VPGFDAYDPEFVRDPYPTYARLRLELGPRRGRTAEPLASWSGESIVSK
jgi:hypothetical protein